MYAFESRTAAEIDRFQAVSICVKTDIELSGLREAGCVSDSLSCSTDLNFVAPPSWNLIEMLTNGCFTQKLVGIVRTH